MEQLKPETIYTEFRRILPKPDVSHSTVKAFNTSTTKKTLRRAYKCSECPEKFNAFRQLKTHEEQHANSVENVCQFCCTLFQNKEILKQHQTECCGKYRCPPCGKEYSSKGYLLKHVAVRHQLKELPYYCGLCPKKAVGRDFGSRVQLQQHYQKTHLDTAHSADEDDMDMEMNEEFLDEFLLSGASQNSFQFSECWEALDLHLPDVLRLPVADCERPDSKVNTAAFKCPKCYKACINQKFLLQHLAHAHGLKLLICGRCESSFESIEQLRQHKALHCQGRKSTGSTKHHQISKRAEPVVLHECPYCSRRFQAAIYLKQHLRTVHSLLKQHICQLCDKQFATLDHLKKHVLSQHQNERKHICDVCAKRFTQLCHLKQHLAIHTTGKTLRCDICEAKFWRKIDLERHTIKTHSMEGENNAKSLK